MPFHYWLFVMSQSKDSKRSPTRPTSKVRSAVLVFDMMPSAGQLPTQVQLTGVAGVIVDNQPQGSLLASRVAGR
jgi:hypothetical protein